MEAWIVVAVVYAWGGLTLLLAMEQMEEIAGAVNELAGPLGLEPIGQHIKGRFGVRAVIVVAWPAWALIWWRGSKKTPNAEVTGLPREGG